MIPSISELWALMPGYTLSLSADADATPTPVRMVGDTAVVSVIGPTTKFGGYGTASTIAARGQLRAAVKSPDVSSIMLYFDSPGGTVAGSADFASDVAAVSRLKPTFAYGSDNLASAAYHVASQAGRVYANREAGVGSIGVMTRLVDMSRYAEEHGVKVHPVTSGGVKGMGIPGTPITQQHLDYAQERINQMATHFVEDVASGRAMQFSQAASLADGRTHFAAQAADLGLIDGVMALDDAIGTLQDFTRRQGN